MAALSTILAWKIPWAEEPGRQQPTGSRRVQHNWSGLACTIHCVPPSFWPFYSWIFLFLHLQSNFAFSPHVTLFSQLWPWALLLVWRWMFLLCCFHLSASNAFIPASCGWRSCLCLPNRKATSKGYFYVCQWFSAETASPTGESCNMVWFEGHQACQPKPPLAAYLKFQPRIISVAP